jgi:tripartite-type tricarboxylate transporter receptor subunit TctC
MRAAVYPPAPARVVLTACLLNCVACAGAASLSAQDFPSKPVRFVTGGAGSNSDFAARVVAQALTGVLGQQVIVENRPSGVILGDIVARAAPDGHTLLVSGSSFWLAPFLQANLPWDPLRDFAPLVLISSAPNLIVVNPSLPIKSVPELIAFARARPGELNYASGSTGSTPHLAAELFKSMAAVNITRINYKGSGQAVSDVIGGQMPLMFAAAGSVISHVKAGRLRALAVTSLRPSPLAPGLPSAAESGVPGYECLSLTGVFLPVKTPAPLLQRLNRDINAVLARIDVRERLLVSGVEAVGGTPAQFNDVVRGEIRRLGKLITDAGIRND